MARIDAHRFRWTLLVVAFGMTALSATLADAAASDGPSVTTAAGPVRGVSINSGEVLAFLGLRYAAPPVGELRWREPQAVVHHREIVTADKFGAMCVQPVFGPAGAHFPAEDVPQSEDCLFLNVWTPAAAIGEGKRPVMVWFHGGGLMVGSGAKPVTIGTNLARKGVVVVSVNYRLGPLGFLVHPELKAESPHRASGNYGLLDQIASLKWVRDNIAAFGGDPNNVTIFGFSAGSTSVNALQATPLARGLFHRAIGHSTSNMNPAAGIWGLRTVAQAEDYGQRYMLSLGAKSLADLRALPARKLVDAPPKFWIIENDGYLFDGEIYDIFASGRHAKVPIMVGATEEEWTTLTKDMKWVRPWLAADVATMRKLYGPDWKSSGDVVDDVVLWQQREWARLNARAGVKNSYLWYFTEVPPAPPKADKTPLGAYHGAELQFVFRTLDVVKWPWTAEQRKLSETLADYWVNFARTGDPNGPGLPVWPNYRDDAVMELSTHLRAAPLPKAEQLRFFDDYFGRQRREGRDNQSE